MPNNKDIKFIVEQQKSKSTNNQFKLNINDKKHTIIDHYITMHKYDEQTNSINFYKSLANEMNRNDKNNKYTKKFTEVFQIFMDYSEKKEYDFNIYNVIVNSISTVFNNIIWLDYNIYEHFNNTYELGYSEIKLLSDSNCKASLHLTSNNCIFLKIKSIFFIKIPDI